MTVPRPLAVELFGGTSWLPSRTTRNAVDIGSSSALVSTNDGQQCRRAEGHGRLSSLAAGGYFRIPMANRRQCDGTQGADCRLVGLTVVLQRRYEVLIEVIAGPVT